MKSISCNILNLLVRREGEIQRQFRGGERKHVEDKCDRAGVGAACVIIVSREKVAFIIRNDRTKVTIIKRLLLSDD